MIVWPLPRDLLTEGRDHGNGEGDVIVWSLPESSEGKEGCTIIRLSSP
ncbi:SsgA family sporulation/cell division regulator [Streptomyces griseochromogenes]